MRSGLHAAWRGHAARGCAVLFAMVALAVMSPLQADSLETIQLHFRTAEDLLPMLQPLVPPGAAVTGTGDLLLVRADARTLQQLRDVVATLDRAPRQLLISVSQVTQAKGTDTSVRGSGTLGSGDVQVGINAPPQADAGGRVLIRNGTASDGFNNVSSVRALEGRETYIALGESRPFTSTTTVSRDRRFPGVISQTTEFRDVQTGFYATPRIVGDRVTLEVSPSQQRVNGDLQRNGTISTSSVTTTVSGRLGEWIEIGGATSGSSGTQSGLVTWGTRSDLTQYSAWLKVDEIR